MLKKIKIFFRFGKSIEENLAYEEYLSGQLAESEGILFLWTSLPCVVIGRNQNPWRECCLKYMQENGIALCRRRSGGGAVYQDPGNLNISFICREEEQDQDLQNRIWIETLKKLGVKAQISGRNDILLDDGSKVSGMAWSQSRGVYIQHGTLLVDLDLDVMEKCLSVSEHKLISKGIKSVRNRVSNIKEKSFLLGKMKTEEAVSAAAEMVVSAALELYKDAAFERCDPEKLIGDTNFKFLEILERYRSFEWNLGHRMQFTWKKAVILPEQETEIEVLVKNGIMEDIRIYSDSMFADDAEIMADLLKGKVFDEELIMNTLKKTEKHK